MARYYYGCDEVSQGWERYYESCNANELDLESFKEQPKLETLNRWRVESPRNFCFMLHVPTALSEYFGQAAGDPPESAEDYPDEVREAWEWTLERTGALAAKAIVFPTPQEVTPGKGHRQRLAAFADDFVDEIGPEVLWEPKGLWTPDQTTDFADEIGFVPVFDPFIAHRDEYEFSHGDVAFAISERPGMRRQFDLFDFKELLRWTEKYDRVFAMVRGRNKWTHVQQLKLAVEQSVVAD